MTEREPDIDDSSQLCFMSFKILTESYCRKLRAIYLFIVKYFYNLFSLFFVKFLAHDCSWIAVEWIHIPDDEQPLSVNSHQISWHLSCVLGVLSWSGFCSHHFLSLHDRSPPSPVLCYHVCLNPRVFPCVASGVLLWHVVFSSSCLSFPVSWFTLLFGLLLYFINKPPILLLFIISRVPRLLSNKLNTDLWIKQ